MRREVHNVLLSFVAAAPVAASGLCEHLDVHSELFGENLELPGLGSPRRESSTRVTPRPLQEKELSVCSGASWLCSPRSLPSGGLPSSPPSPVRSGACSVGKACHGPTGRTAKSFSSRGKAAGHGPKAMCSHLIFFNN